jgi:hypothetical protein
MWASVSGRELGNVACVHVYIRSICNHIDILFQLREHVCVCVCVCVCV